MIRSFARSLALALVVATATLGCGSPAIASVANGGDDLVLKAYDVPAEHAAEFEGIVKNLLYTGKDTPRRGTAALSPTGQLLVSAPPGFQPGIADAINKLKLSPAQRAPTVTLDYWVVVGTPAGAATPGQEVALEIGDVVDGLQKSQGPMKMGLLEHARLSSQSGSAAREEGAQVRISQTAALHGDKVVADIEVKRMNQAGGIDSRVEIPLAKTVILGQAGTTILGGSVNPAMAQAQAPAGFVDEATTGKAVTVFTIVRATVDAQ